jgi:putative DNA primase/helicase
MSEVQSRISTNLRCADASEALREAMAAEGISTREPINPDGRIHRVYVEGDRRGTRNGWYVLHADRIAAGAFGSWRLGVTKTWHGAQLHHTEVEARGALQEQLSEAERQRHDDEVRLHERARSKAEKIWARAMPAPTDHAYLIKKQIKADRLRASCGRILVPLYDADDVLRSLQFITRDGSKLFLAGGLVRGCFYLMGKPNGKLFVAEGFATGATVHEATGEAVAVAFNAGNLEPVAMVLRKKHPQVELVIVADNDAWTPGNPGLTKAKDAARAVRGGVAVPEFQDTTTRPTDFNDLLVLEGV